MKILATFVVALASLSNNPLQAQFISVGNWSFHVITPVATNFGASTVLADGVLSGFSGVEMRASASATETGVGGGSGEIRSFAYGTIEIGPAGASVRIDELLSGVLNMEDVHHGDDHASLRTSVSFACTTTGFRQDAITVAPSTQIYANQVASTVVCLGEGFYDVTVGLWATARIGFDSASTHTNSSDFFSGLRSWTVEFSGISGPDACVQVGVPDPVCAALPNSTGAFATVELRRTLTDPLILISPTWGLVRSGPPGQPGFFLVSQSPGGYNIPVFSSGLFCLGPPIYRLTFPIFIFDPAGVSIFCGPGTQIPTNGSFGGFPAMAAGSTWYFQAWYRDLNPTQTSNFSNSVAYTFF